MSMDNFTEDKMGFFADHRAAETNLTGIDFLLLSL